MIVGTSDPLQSRRRARLSLLVKQVRRREAIGDEGGAGRAIDALRREPELIGDWLGIGGREQSLPNAPAVNDLMGCLAAMECSVPVSEQLLRTCVSGFLVAPAHTLKRLRREARLGAAVERAVLLLSEEHPLVRRYRQAETFAASRMARLMVAGGDPESSDLPR